MKNPVERLFTKYVKPMGLPPRLAGGVRQAMEAAAGKSNGDKKETKTSIKTYLKERGYDPTTGKKLEGAAVAKKPKGALKDETTAPDPDKQPAKPSVSDDPAKDALIAADAKKALKGDEEAGIKPGNIDLMKLGRATLKGMAKDLEAGYKKAWSDDELRSNVASKMIGMDEKAMAKIASADPAKIAALDDCIGVLLDLTKAICITCPAQADCRKLFEQHRADGFKIFDTLQPGTVASTNDLGKKAPSKSADDTSIKIKVVPFKKVAKLARVSVDDAVVPNNLDHKDFLIALKKTPPVDFTAFKSLVLDHYDVADGGNDVGLANWFMKYCVALGVIALS